MYTDSLKHKPMTDSPWLAIYDNHGYDPCRGKDKSLLEMQHKFAAVTTPLVRAIEKVDGSQPELDRRQLLVHLSHCLTFLGRAQFHVSMQ